ncbi:DUF397 domain-containing protein [Amycolatopsis rubida]|uniref:DUF397 domain-containing protein n=1 Tax=Amycolatopsis rubida TaxID=112413 RepID=A0ABX0C5G9_9PSEU|nr:MULTISPECIES: DUF397 domain-containing protein [Amycolatopsis]MYW90502.1 DUF397 domain-containing protein [Amycolatopsis rubida]MYW95130.1 DUF397 domain-containing protein [Amycolatopsis rubida]NEC55481.1 DUF397 domain-containing protein [Amycolatopsis rubida]NEC60118.1 DUF397 domain-containing protein [Amycolatopsis rubida]
MGKHRMDDKAHIRHDLNLDKAKWNRIEPSNADSDDGAEYATVPHADGDTYVALRKANDSNGVVLVFTPSEWSAFQQGVRDGEFDLPQ